VWAEPLTRKKAMTELQNNNPLMIKSITNECKYGSKEHQQITSLKCSWKGLCQKDAWKGLCQKDVAQNYGRDEVVGWPT
jgi:hypothetical protein